MNMQKFQINQDKRSNKYHLDQTCPKRRRDRWYQKINNMRWKESNQVYCLFEEITPAVPLSRPTVSDSMWPHDLKPTRLLCPWGYSRQESWSELPCSPLGDPPDPRIEPRSPALQVNSLPAEPPGKPHNAYYIITTLDNVLNGQFSHIVQNGIAVLIGGSAFT